MNVIAQKHDDVSALLTVTIEKSDYKDNVEKQLHRYAKTAQVPGFRKGKVPLSMVRRQYEVPASYDEINRQISEALNNYITEEKLRLIGQPVAEPIQGFDLNAEKISVNFEIGFEQDFSIDLTKFEADHYKVEATDKEVNQSIENMQKRFAEREAQTKATKDSFISLQISQIVEEDAEGEHNHPPKFRTISKEQKESFELVKKLKVEETIKISKQELLDNEELSKQLGIDKAELENIHHNELEIKVTEIYKLNLHEINQELFDKVYGKDEVKSEEELKNKVKTELDEYFQQNADVYFVNTILEQVTEKQEVKLPEEFLVKWILSSNQNIPSEEKAREILEAERNQIKFQIIEGRLVSDNGIKIDYTDLLSHAELMIRNQLAMYGLHHLPEEEIQKYAVETLKNQEQVRQISSEVAMGKLKDVILEKAGKKEVKISHDEFLKKIEKKQEN